MPIPFLAHANRPARVFIRSDDAVDRSGGGNPSDFVYPLSENILNAKAVQVLSCRIPNIFPQVPNYQRWFLYMLTDFTGAVHYRGFKLNAVSDTVRYFANYQDLVNQLNIDAAFWVEFNDVGVPQTTTESYLTALQPGQPKDVSFTYDAASRKILTNNVAPVPPAAGIQLTAGVNNRLKFFAANPANPSVYIDIAPGLYVGATNLATALNAAFAAKGFPMTASVVNATTLSYSWGGASGAYFMSFSFNSVNPDPNYPLSLAQGTAAALGFIFPSGFYTVSVPFQNPNPIAFNVTPTAPTLQLASVVQSVQMLSKTELVKPYLFLNQILGYNVGSPQPAVPVPAGIPIVPFSFPNLVRTQTIYIQSNTTLNGTLTSNGLRNVIQTIPVTVPQLGVISFQSTQPHYIFNCPENLAAISIRLIDENGQYLPMTLNAQTEFELGFLYDDSELP